MLPKAQINATFCLKDVLGEIEGISLMKIISMENEDQKQNVFFLMFTSDLPQNIM